MDNLISWIIKTPEYTILNASVCKSTNKKFYMKEIFYINKPCMK